MTDTLSLDITYTLRVVCEVVGMAWGRVDVDGQRVGFVEAASCGARGFAGLCRAYGISRSTGYVWLKRYREEGVGGIAERSRRPLHSPTRSSAELEEAVAGLRRRYPDWGARKLAVLLGRDGVAVPAATVHRVLKRQGLLHPSDVRRPATGRFCRDEPNQLWQMDFKSPKGWGTHLGPLSVLDDHSRYAVALEQLPSGRAGHVQARLERAFGECGVPEAMLMDHGQPWWNAQSSGGWTQLGVWLMRVGVRLYFSGIRHPQTQGKVERFHGSLEKARRRRGPADGNPQPWLDRFRDDYNHLRPHEALGMRTPASLWRPGNRAFTGPRDPVYDTHAEVHQLNHNGALRIEGRTWPVAGALAGQHVRIHRIQPRAMVFYSNTLIREIHLAGHGSTAVEPRPANSLKL